MRPRIPRARHRRKTIPIEAEMKTGKNLDLLINDGAVQVFRCCRHGLRMWLFWAFVAAAIAGSVALAILGI